MKMIKRTFLSASFTLILLSLALLGIEYSRAESPAAMSLVTLQLALPEPENKSDREVGALLAADQSGFSRIEPNRVKTDAALFRPTATAHEGSGAKPRGSSISQIGQIGQINLAHPIISSTISSTNDRFRAASGPHLDPGQPEESRPPETGVLSIPKLDLDTEIVSLPNYGSGWNLGLIEKEVALLGGTGRFPLDDQAMVFSGHVVDMWEFGPFFNLNKLMPRDELSYVYRNQEFVYQVSRLMVVEPDRADLLYQNNGEQLILMTCSDYSIRSGIFEKRLLVIADLVDVQPVSPNLGLSDENPIFNN